MVLDFKDLAPDYILVHPGYRCWDPTLKEAESEEEDIEVTVKPKTLEYKMSNEEKEIQRLRKEIREKDAVIQELQADNPETETWNEDGSEYKTSFTFETPKGGPKTRLRSELDHSELKSTDIINMITFMVNRAGIDE